MDCSPPGSFVHGVFQARIIEWVAISFSRDLPDPGIEHESPALQAGFCRLSYQLRAWQQPTSNWGDLKGVNNGWWINIQGSGTPETTARLFLALWKISFLFDGLKPFLAARLMPSQKKKKLKVHLSLRVYTLPSPVIKAPTSRDNHTSLNKNFTNSLKLSLLWSTSIIRQGQ